MPPTTPSCKGHCFYFHWFRYANNNSTSRRFYKIYLASLPLKNCHPPIYTLCLTVTTLCKPVIQTVAVWFSLHDVWHLSKDTETWKPNVAETPESNELEEANPQFPLLGPLELSLFSTLSQPCEFSYSFLNQFCIIKNLAGFCLQVSSLVIEESWLFVVGPLNHTSSR